MIATTALYVSLVLFGAGLLYKVSTWFRYRIGKEARQIPAFERVLAAFGGVMATVFSRKIVTILKVFLLQVLLQQRTLREDPLRWLMHMCVYLGFTLLLLMHALGSVITSGFFPGYYSTVNPFLFLRDIFGVFVIFGLLLALYRRFILKVPRLVTNAMDYYAIIIVAVIILSGILTEGTKMVSYSSYRKMVEEYGAAENEKESRSLEAYWIEKFAMVSPAVKGPFDKETLDRGRELHEITCADCHSRPQWAFAGYGVARAVRPFALSLDRTGIPVILWYIHIMACFVGLVYVPFSKMFHIVASPLSLLANAVMERGRSSPANMATKQAMELDACTHCGTCTVRCSVGVAFEEIPNPNILPSERIASLKALASGRKLGAKEIRILQEGVYLCTNCYRCTLVCPVGINLQDLWFTVREDLLERGYPEFLILSPLSFYRGLMHREIEEGDYERPLDRARKAITAECDLMVHQERDLELTPSGRALKGELSLSAQAKTFSVCFGCETCTTVCPVVSNFQNPGETLGLLPHQIMHACALGIRDLAFGSVMLWDCITCYQCQEQCPQQVAVTDVLYELKNLAVRRIKERHFDEMGKG
ncbi:MAG: 4Fe-4S dicluster domain-containing protein [Deltaproteobacteria bacterium]|nr:4Fe-4S dicluster domain-containing protein [Deltaproteobacteria bacterium]